MYTTTQEAVKVLNSRVQNAVVNYVSIPFSNVEDIEISEEEISNAMKSGVPAARFGTANEVANAVVFLCTPAASYINGINVPVDGGRTKSL